MELPIEVGVDFVARKHHTYYVSNDSYAEKDDPAEVPPELAPMRAEVRRLLKITSDPKTEIVKSTMSRSLLEPTTKTFFECAEMKFVVVEPRVAAEDVRRWSRL